MTQEELTDLIDLAYEAVDKSNIGPMLAAVPPHQPGMLRDTAWGTFQIVLSNLIPKVNTVRGGTTTKVEVVQEKKKWQEGYKQLTEKLPKST